MLKIVKASEPVPVNQIVVCLYGPPGLGKTSLAFTADAPLLLDCDGGVHRASNRKDAVRPAKWEEIANLTASDLQPYKTIVVDTAGRALDLLSVMLLQNPKNGNKMGGLSLPGFGVLKTTFALWLAAMKSFGKDVVLITHMDEQRHGDDVIERLDVQGGSKNEIYKSADAMGRVIIRPNSERCIDFNPKENSFGKNPCALPVIPFALSNTACLGDIIRTIKERLNGATAQPAAEQKKAAPKANGTNGTAPRNVSCFDDGLHVRGVIEKVIARDDKRQVFKAKNGSQYVKVIVAGQTYYAFDNAERVIVNGGEHKLRLFGMLAEAKPNDAIDLTYEVSKKGGRSIKEVTRLGVWEWEAGTGLPVIQRGAQANPEVTDADIPF